MSRFSVTYRIVAGDAREARARAEGVAYEQTVEVPPDVVPPGVEAAGIVGRIEEIGADGEGRFRATISYSPDSAGADLAQLLNVVFGNSSMQRGIRVVAVEPGPTVAARHPGARFGVEGIRRLCGRASGGLIAPVLKPQGLSADALAGLAHRFALAGADIVKEDHGLGDLPAAPFRPRVEAVVAALARAEAESGRRPLYVACLPGPWDRIEGNIAFAKAAGVDGLLVMPGLMGHGLIPRIAADEALAMPVMAHPAWQGSFVQTDEGGIAPDVLWGTLPRLAGADLSIFPSWGGRFGLSREDCVRLVHACHDPKGPGRPILPTPGGGMNVERASEMRAAYGKDVCYLLGGALLRHREALAEPMARMRAALDA